MTRSRVIADASIAVAVGFLLAILALRFPHGLVPGDAYEYLAAGERLNAGHPLYALSPGDRPVHLEPPYWTVPLLSPPPVAVVFRALAIFPSETGVGLWWALHIASVTTAFVLVARRRPVTAALALFVLAFPFAYELSVGNLNGFVLLGLVLTWRATVRGQDRAGGIMAGAATAFKVTPALLGWWLLTTGRWRAVRWMAATGLVALAVSLVGAGLDAHLAYLGIAANSAVSAAFPLSLGGAGRAVGLPSGIANLLPLAALILGLAGIWLLRGRPDRAFQLTVVTMVLGAPTVSISWFALLFAALAPLAWPLPAADPAGASASEAANQPTAAPS